MRNVQTGCQSKAVILLPNSILSYLEKFQESLDPNYPRSPHCSVSIQFVAVKTHSVFTDSLHLIHYRSHNETGFAKRARKIR